MPLPALALMIPAALQIAGTGLKMFGQHQEASKAQDLANYNAAIALDDARLIEASARLEIGRGREQGQRFIGSQRARYAKSGVTSDGSPFEVLAQTATDIEMDLQMDYYNSQVAARRSRIQASFDQAQAGQYKTQKWLQPLGTLATGATKLAITSGLGG